MIKKILLLTALFVLCPAAQAHAAEIIVTISNQQFSDDAIKVKAGDTVNLRNNDTITHNIQIANAKGDIDDRGLQKSGEAIKATFAKPGEYRITCGIHPAMKLKVSVE